MAKRIAVVLSGCGWGDGSDAAETMLMLVAAERAGARVICAAPDRDQKAVVDHLTGKPVEGAGRNARVEAARLAGGPVLPLAELRANALEGLLIPGGAGVETTLSDYAEKHELCTVDPDLAKLLRDLLGARRPMGFSGLAALLAARVLGPAAGVRLTLGAKGTPPGKHAAIMGADVRPATVADVISDEQARVHTTPGFFGEAPTLPGVARSIDQLVRAVVGGGKKPSGPRRA
jgi:enhancing lycopene biosynthesis protein 2